MVTSRPEPYTSTWIAFPQCRHTSYACCSGAGSTVWPSLAAISETGRKFARSHVDRVTKRADLPDLLSIERLGADQVRELYGLAVSRVNQFVAVDAANGNR